MHNSVPAETHAHTQTKHKDVHLFVCSAHTETQKDQMETLILHEMLQKNAESLVEFFPVINERPFFLSPNRIAKIMIVFNSVSEGFLVSSHDLNDLY